VTYVRRTAGVHGDDAGGRLYHGFTTVKNETQKSLDFFIQSVRNEDHQRRIYILWRRVLRRSAWAGYENKRPASSGTRSRRSTSDDRRETPTIAVQGERHAVGRVRGRLMSEATLEPDPLESPLIGFGQNGNASISSWTGRRRVGVPTSGAPEAHGKLPDRRQLPPARFNLKVKDGDVTVSNVNPGAAGAGRGERTRKRA